MINANKVSGLRTDLYEHQVSLLEMILEIEDKKYITSTGKYRNKIIITTNSIVLSEPFGSGKTIVILALISAKRVPTAHEVPSKFSSVKKSRIPHHITVRYDEPNTHLIPNLIIVGVSVLVQWKETIEKFTDLRYVSISNYYDLLKLRTMITDRSVNSYDIVLLKNGSVTGNMDKFGLHGRSSNIIEVVSTFGGIWSRVIYDDFDVIRIPYNCPDIDSIFNIFISATRKQYYASPSLTRQVSSIHDLLTSKRIGEYAQDDLLFTKFNVNTNGSISFDLPKILYYSYMCENNNKSYYELLKLMRDQSVDLITEMLNGDALRTAAASVGIHSNSVADIFHKILGDKYKDKTKYKRRVDTYEKYINIATHSRKGPVDVNRILSDISNGRDVDIVSSSDELIESLIREKNLIQQELSVVENTIERVRENLTQRECAVCILPADSQDVFILKCCSVVLCGVCGIKGSRWNKYKDIGSCPACNSVISPDDMILVSNSISDEDTPYKFNDKTSDNYNPSSTSTKISVLLDILTGKRGNIINIKLPGLADGINVIDNRDTFKFVIFTDYDETVENINDILTKNNYVSLVLGGGSKNISNTVKLFESISNSVLIINSQKHCAGLNIQFATDIVFFQRINDKAIESQIIGRGQRIGRSSSLRVHYIVYNDE